MSEEFPILGAEEVLKAFPDLKTGPVLKAFPDLEVGQVLRIHREELGDPHGEGENLSLVILRALPGAEGLRIGPVSSDPTEVEEAAAATSEALGSVAVTVLDEQDWAVLVSVTDIRPATDD